MDKITVTYDSIFEILMREKSKEELQKLSPEFFKDLVKYVSDKRKSASSEATDTFSLEEKERASKQLQNIKRMMTELYERREKKIMNMSMIRSRTGADIIDTTPLLSEEKMFFDAIVAQLDYYRNSILFKLLNAQPMSAEEKPEIPETKKNTKLIRFLHDVPKFVGKELEVYGPFVEEDMANIPSEMADILIKKGRAEEVT
ncbi:hypothetical protein CMO88_02115 [Candidatus Woesearchaeota archaeon]|nr:hypothetical protein [Candidatus Woesearchaeota archaeon]|tara:strand:+ start:3280 stop:3882 length:603 start_codon:yes stop_codon:yes gene_type:complete